MATIKLNANQQATYNAGAAKYGVNPATATPATGGGLTTSQVQAGYSTVPGSFSPLTGQPISPTTTPGATPAVDISQPSPATVNATPYTVKAGDTLSGIAQAQGMSTADILKNNPSITDPNKISAGGSLNLGKQSAAQQGFNTAMASGVSAPQDGSATGNTKSLMPQDNIAPAVPPAVQNFIDPNTNTGMADQVSQLMEIISPQATRDSLAQEMKSLNAEKNAAVGMKTDLMNMKNVMAGAEQDIRDEVTKASGFATDSQVLALTTSRNSTLLKQATLLQDQLTAQNDMIANDTTMLASDKADAASQLSTRMGLMNYIQTNNNNQLNAFKSGITTQINTPGGLTALASDPSHSAIAEQTMGWAPGTIKSMAVQAQKNQSLDNQQKQASINASNSTIAKNSYDMTTPPATPDPTSNSILAATGMSIPAFYVLTGQSSNLPRDAATRKAAMAEAGTWANAHGVDISTLGSEYKAQNDVLQTNIARAANTKVFAGEVAGSADALMSAINEKDLNPGFFNKILGIGAFKPANLVSLATGKQVNDPLTMKYATQLQAMTNDYAGYLAAARGAKSPELTDLNDAAQVVSKGLNSGSTQAFKEAIQLNETKVAGVVDRAVNDAQNSVWTLFGVTKPKTGGGTVDQQHADPLGLGI